MKQTSLWTTHFYETNLVFLNMIMAESKCFMFFYFFW
jgi:hypothetical protein